MLWQFLPTRGLSKLASYLAALYVILPQLDSIGLSGVLFLCILGVLYNFWGSSDSGHSFQYSFPDMDPFLFHFLRMLIILFLYLCVASLLSLVYVFVFVFVSPTMSVIFSIFGSVYDYCGSTFVCRSMMMELSFFSVCITILSPLLMLDFGSLVHLMVHTTCPLSSSAAVSVMYFATTSIPAMISSTGRVDEEMAKSKPLLSIDYSSSLICLSLRIITHLFLSMSVSVTSFLLWDLL